MVEETSRHESAMFVCEFCGSGYGAIGDAEACEQHCGTLGFASAEIRRKAVLVPKIEMMPLL